MRNMSMPFEHIRKNRENGQHAETVACCEVRLAERHSEIRACWHLAAGCPRSREPQSRAVQTISYARCEPHILLSGGCRSKKANSRELDKPGGSLVASSPT